MLCYRVVIAFVINQPDYQELHTICTITATTCWLMKLFVLFCRISLNAKFN